jgi:hypothetical protein
MAFVTFSDAGQANAKGRVWSNGFSIGVILLFIKIKTFIAVENNLWDIVIFSGEFSTGVSLMVHFTTVTIKNNIFFFILKIILVFHFVSFMTCDRTVRADAKTAFFTKAGNTFKIALIKMIFSVGFEGAFEIFFIKYFS